SRPGQGDRPEDGAPHQRDRAGGEPRHDRLFRVEAVVNRVVTGAHYGLRDWLAQRITAAIMAVYSLIVLFVLSGAKPITYGMWKDLFTQGWMRVATLLFAASLVWHAWVGVRDVLMDYIKPTGLRLAPEVFTLVLLA